ncbi:hypothetical protein P3X46_017497 [Hevea brasiliensis]|uniref:BAG domain-containing protein n=1 Tax=Hevea brasiliensis TaxID=3981 RepID=A0ABQ9LP37_HEVBR|nr:BAG family molecular chaperone regulator 6 [Hevea brasiliensis]KAJ9169290.1 hypothetical protein P3X46_017497 [Hevea brasiliensis]
MDNLFFRSHLSYPSTPRYYYPPVRHVPVHRQTTTVQKVVEIPVRYVESAPSRLDSVVKIQKVFRGFLVRKSVRKIAAIRREVDEIETRISMKETVELIRRDSKEPLKVNEMLMNLLLRLDSVPGVDSGVKNCRRAVIKKAIRLQEMVDAIVAGDQALEVDDFAKKGEEDDDQTPENQVRAPDSEGIVANSAFNSNSSKKLQNHVGSVPKSDSVSIDDVGESEKMPEVFEETSKLQNPGQQDSKTAREGLGGVEAEVEVIEDGNMEDNVSLSGSECAESVDVSREESQVDSSGNPEDDPLENLEAVADQNEVRHEKEQSCGDKNEASGKSRELLERMMEDNEKMMGMMTELFERNEMQTGLLSSLSQRVEQLERALMCERSKRKKKKRNAVVLVDCLESTQDAKKCGKR